MSTDEISQLGNHGNVKHSDHTKNNERPMSTFKGYIDRIHNRNRLYSKLIQNEHRYLTFLYSMELYKTGIKTTKQLPTIQDSSERNRINMGNMNTDNSNHKISEKNDIPHPNNWNDNLNKSDDGESSESRNPSKKNPTYIVTSIMLTMNHDN